MNQEQISFTYTVKPIKMGNDINPLEKDPACFVSMVTILKWKLLHLQLE